MKRGALPILFLHVVIELPGMSLILPLLACYAKSFSASAVARPSARNAEGSRPDAQRAVHRPALRPVRPVPLILAGALATAAGFVMLGFVRSLRLSTRRER